MNQRFIHVTLLTEGDCVWVRVIIVDLYLKWEEMWEELELEKEPEEEQEGMLEVEQNTGLPSKLQYTFFVWLHALCQVETWAKGEIVETALFLCFICKQ